MKVLDLFSGIGAFSLGLERAGMKTMAFCESDPKCRAVLVRHWPDVRIYEDVRHISGFIFEEKPDVICGGFPCQFTSTAARGRNNAKNLWPEFLRVVASTRSTWVVAENVPGIGDDGIERVCNDLEAQGYWVWPVEIDTSPPLRSRGRSRVFWLAYAHGEGESRRAFDGEMACLPALPRYGWADYAAPVGMDDGLPGRMDRLHQLGNAVTPYAAEIIGRAILKTTAQQRD